MPDKKQRSSLVDRGWQQMSAILDAEMPAGRRRGFLAWLPWGIAGMALVLIAGWLLVRGDGTTTPETQTTTPATFDAPDQEPTPETGHQSLTYSEALKEDAGNMYAASTEKAGVNDAGTTTKLPSQYRDQEHIDAVVTEEADHRVISANQARNDLQDERVTQDSRIKSLTPDADAITEPGAAKHTVTHDLIEAPGSIHAAMVALYQTPRSQPSMEIPVFRSHRAGLEVFGGAHFSDVIEVHGVEAGLAVAYDISPRFTLRGGASLGHYQENGLLRIGSTKASRLDAELANSGGAFNYDPSLGVWTGPFTNADLVSYDTTRLLTHEFNYIHFPVTLSYKLKGRFVVSAGLKYSRLISAPAEYQAVPTTLNTHASRNYLYEYNLLRKHDIAPVAGISWRISRHIMLDATYHHGLIPYVDKSDVPGRSDFNRTISIGVRYRVF